MCNYYFAFLNIFGKNIDLFSEIKIFKKLTCQLNYLSAFSQSLILNCYFLYAYRSLIFYNYSNLKKNNLLKKNTKHRLLMISLQEIIKIKVKIKKKKQEYK
jgi:hypothetical protein